MPTIFSDILIEKKTTLLINSLSLEDVIAHTLTSRKSQNLPTNTNRKNATPLDINTAMDKLDFDESFSNIFKIWESFSFVKERLYW